MHLSIQWGETALTKASAAGKLECVKLLLDSGVQVNVQNKVSAVGVPVMTISPLCRVNSKCWGSFPIKLYCLISILLGR